MSRGAIVEVLAEAGAATEQIGLLAGQDCDRPDAAMPGEWAALLRGVPPQQLEHGLEVVPDALEAKDVSEVGWGEPFWLDPSWLEDSQ